MPRAASVDGKVLVRQQGALARLPQDRIEEGTRDIARQQPFTVLAKGGRRPDRFVQAQADEPPEQDAVVDLLHQEPLAAHRVRACSNSARSNGSGGIDRRPTAAYIR